MYRLKTIFRRFLTDHFVPHRSGGFPFITSDGLRSFADHVHDESYRCDPSSVVSGDLIFVRTNQLKDFFAMVHPHINVSYILVSHNDDVSVDPDLVHMFDDSKIVHWFAQNVTFSHPKLTPMPLGIYSRFYDKKNLTVKNLRENMAKENKMPRIFYGFSLITNEQLRSEVLSLLKGNPLSYGSDQLVSKEDYFKAMSDSMMVAAPRGNGEDTHRVWEALYAGTVPIVQRSPSTEFWKEMGLPLHLIDSWSEIDQLTEDEIRRIYQWAKPLFSHKAIWLPYWIEIFEKFRSNVK